MPSDSHFIEKLLAAGVVVDASVALVIERTLVGRHLAAVASHRPAHLPGYRLEESRVALRKFKRERVERLCWNCCCYHNQIRI